MLHGVCSAVVSGGQNDEEVPTTGALTHYKGGGGGFSWHFNFAWEISRFKLTAKFPTGDSGFSANFSHTSSTHWGLWQGVIHSTGGLREISHGEIYHREFELARKSPPPLCGVHDFFFKNITSPNSKC